MSDMETHESDNTKKNILKKLGIGLLPYFLFLLSSNLHAQYWHLVATPYGPVSNMSFISASDGWVTTTGSPQKLLHTLDGAASFQVVKEFNPNQGLKSFQMLDNLAGYGLIYEGGQTYTSLCKTMDGGSTWIELAYDNITSFFFVDQSLGFYANSSGIFKTVDNGQTWQYVVMPDFPYPLPNPLFMVNDIYFTDSRHGFAACNVLIDGGCGIKTIDGGETWQITSYSCEMKDVHFCDSLHGGMVGNGGWGGCSMFTLDAYNSSYYEFDFDNLNLTTPIAINYFNDSVIWVGGKPAYFLRSVDRGLTFQVFDSSLVDDSGNAILEIVFNDSIGYALTNVGMFKLPKEMYNQIISNNALLSPITAYPNPCLDQSTLTFASDKTGTALLQLLDAQGQVAQTHALQAHSGNNQLPLDLTKLPPGLYLMRLALMEKVLTGKLLKGGR